MVELSRALNTRLNHNVDLKLVSDSKGGVNK